MSGNYLNWESVVMRLVGINRARMRELRGGLTEGEDFTREKRRVVYTDAGLKKIRALLSLPEQKNAPAANDAQPEPVRLLVWNPRLSNKRMILAYRPGTDPRFAENLVRVAVRSSENFVKFVNGVPMELWARRIDGGAPDHFELAGRCPKRKGRW